MVWDKTTRPNTTVFLIQHLGLMNHEVLCKAKKLNTKRRSHFSPEDICQFLLELDGMELAPGKEDKDFYY
jgi:hypothetical protein